MTRGSGSAGPQAAFLASNDPSALRDNDDAVNFRGVQNEWVGLLATLEQAAGLGWAGCWRKRGARGVDSGGHERARQCTAAHARIVRMHATVQVRAQRPGDFSVRGPPPRRATATRVGKRACTPEPSPFAAAARAVRPVPWHTADHGACCTPALAQAPTQLSMHNSNYSTASVHGPLSSSTNLLHPNGSGGSDDSHTSSQSMSMLRSGSGSHHGGTRALKERPKTRYEDFESGQKKLVSQSHSHAYDIMPDIDLLNQMEPEKDDALHDPGRRAARFGADRRIGESPDYKKSISVVSARGLLNAGALIVIMLAVRRRPVVEPVVEASADAERFHTSSSSPCSECIPSSAGSSRSTRLPTCSTRRGRCPSFGGTAA